MKRKAAFATVAEAGEAEQVARWPTPAQSGELVAAVQTGVGSGALSKEAPPCREPEPPGGASELRSAQRGGRPEGSAAESLPVATVTPRERGTQALAADELVELALLGRVCGVDDGREVEVGVDCLA